MLYQLYLQGQLPKIYILILINKSIIDLFSGAGGMSEGFIMEGFNVIGSNEMKSIFLKPINKITQQLIMKIH